MDNRSLNYSKIGVNTSAHPCNLNGTIDNRSLNYNEIGLNTSASPCSIRLLVGCTYVELQGESRELEKKAKKTPGKHLSLSFFDKAHISLSILGGKFIKVTWLRDHLSYFFHKSQFYPSPGKNQNQSFVIIIDPHGRTTVTILRFLFSHMSSVRRYFSKSSKTKSF